MTAPNYKALAMNMFEIAFVSGLSSQEAADKAAMEACEKAKRPPNDGTLAQAEYRCDLFASGRCRGHAAHQYCDAADALD